MAPWIIENLSLAVAVAPFETNVGWAPPKTCISISGYVKRANLRLT